MENTLDSVRAQMRKGLLEYCILSILDKREAYASVIIEELKAVGILEYCCNVTEHDAGLRKIRNSTDIIF